MAMLAIAISACQSTTLPQTKELNRGAGETRVILMPPDVQLSELDAGGVLEPKADWTEAAKRDMVTAFHAQGTERNLVMVDYDESKLPPDKAEALHSVTKLYAAVGLSIFAHQYPGALQLPTKQHSFDWSLGPSVAVLREQYGADYALLTYARDSYSTGGRIALQVVAAAVVGVGIPGGTQLAFVSLIDLRTGDIIWYNRLLRQTGDLRGEKAARGTVATLMERFPK
ncbi:MAG TPA: hypothetical protein VMU85_09365 [Stellaceae bacterium]|nr:hypothetical protein [Stellaceae bacterium]